MSSLIAKEPVQNRAALPSDPEDGEGRFLLDEGYAVVFDTEKQVWLNMAYSSQEKYDRLVNDMLVLESDVLELLIGEVMARRNLRMRQFL